MKTSKHTFSLAATLLLVAATFTGCESSDTGGHPTTNVYYGVGFYDPWYYGGYYGDDVDIIVSPPSSGSRPEGGPPPRPSQPIARPPSQGARPSQPIAQPPTASQMPAARPMPSIPSTPRASPRR
jgi:hypothetical protein